MVPDSHLASVSSSVKWGRNSLCPACLPEGTGGLWRRQSGCRPGVWGRHRFNPGPPLTTWETPYRPHDHSIYCKQSICYVPGIINLLSWVNKGDKHPVARESDSQMPTWAQHSSWGQPCPRGSHPGVLPPSPHCPWPRATRRAGPWLCPHCTMRKSAGVWDRRGQAISGHQWSRPRLTYFPH